MARLVSWPQGIKITSFEPTNGPVAIGAGGSKSLGGYTQTVAGIGFQWEFTVSFTAMQNALARSFRGAVMALHSGANALRYTWIDGDRRRASDLGLTGDFALPVPWDSGGTDVNWSNGQGWQASLPKEEIAAAAAYMATEITLSATSWGELLGVGDYLGFTGQFGVYMVTEVFEPGRYRIFPPLRRAVTVADYATLEPVVVVRPMGPDAIRVPRNISLIEGATASFIEVLDRDVRDFFTG